MSVFNVNARAYETGDYPLFLGEEMGLYDSINKKYPVFFDLYKQQKSIDWSEDEVDLQQSRVDLETCDKATYDLMVKTLAFQWELDSVANRSIAPLLAPFVTNSEYWAMLVKQSEIEVTHALTYSEIVRQCVKDPKDVFNEVMKNDNILFRAEKVMSVFNEIQQLGAQYVLGVVTDKQYVRERLIVALSALYALEAIEFMASFAVTFAFAEQGIFMGIAQLVQKIIADEQLHVMMDREAVKVLMKQPEWVEAYSSVKGEVKSVLDETVRAELSWNGYLFSEGRYLLGLNADLLSDWVLHRAKPVYDVLGVNYSFKIVEENPLPWMKGWMNIDSQQNANQEQSNNNYCMNVVVNDVGDEVLDF